MWLTQSNRYDCISHSSREQNVALFLGEKRRAKGLKEKRRVAQADVTRCIENGNRRKAEAYPSVILAA